MCVRVGACVSAKKREKAVLNQTDVDGSLTKANEAFHILILS